MKIPPYLLYVEDVVNNKYHAFEETQEGLQFIIENWLTSVFPGSVKIMFTIPEGTPTPDPECIDKAFGVVSDMNRVEAPLIFNRLYNEEYFEETEWYIER
jgi:hypothetical protein